MCLCMTPSWKRVSAATRPSRYASSALSTTTSAGWTPRPTPAKSKTNFRYEHIPGFMTQPTSVPLSTALGLSLQEWLCIYPSSVCSSRQLRRNSRTESVIADTCFFFNYEYVLELRSYLILVQVVCGDKFVDTGVNFKLLDPCRDSGLLNISVQLECVLDPHNSRWGLGTSSVGFTWELVRCAESWVPPDLLNESL